MDNVEQEQPVNPFGLIRLIANDEASVALHDFQQDASLAIMSAFALTQEEIGVTQDVNLAAGEAQERAYRDMLARTEWRPYLNTQAIQAAQAFQESMARILADAGAPLSDIESLHAQWVEDTLALDESPYWIVVTARMSQAYWRRISRERRLARLHKRTRRKHRAMARRRRKGLA